MNKTVTCPYNRSHVVSSDRIQYHLTKCRKKHQHLDFVICSYNATHHIPRSEESKHLRECPDRIFEEMDTYKFNEVPQYLQGYIPNPIKLGSEFIAPKVLNTAPRDADESGSLFTVASMSSKGSLLTAKSNCSILEKRSLEKNKELSSKYGRTTFMRSHNQPK